MADNRSEENAQFKSKSEGKWNLLFEFLFSYSIQRIGWINSHHKSIDFWLNIWQSIAANRCEFTKGKKPVLKLLWVRRISYKE